MGHALCRHCQTHRLDRWWRRKRRGGGEGGRGGERGGGGGGGGERGGGGGGGGGGMNCGIGSITVYVATRTVAARIKLTFVLRATIVQR